MVNFFLWNCKWLDPIFICIQFITNSTILQKSQIFKVDFFESEYNFRSDVLHTKCQPFSLIEWKQQTFFLWHILYIVIANFCFCTGERTKNMSQQLMTFTGAPIKVAELHCANRPLPCNTVSSFFMIPRTVRLFLG